MCTGMAAGAVCLKKPHHIVILQFSEVVKCHANRIELVKKCDLFRYLYFFEESYGENSDMNSVKVFLQNMCIRK